LGTTPLEILLNLSQALIDRAHLGRPCSKGV
jgi:hypothetical protein